MALRLIDRIGTLVKADAHGVVESLEDRTLLLKQSLREAELALVQKRARLETLADEEHRLSEERKQLAATIESLDRDIELALQEDREALARFSIRKLIPEREALSATIVQFDEVAAEKTQIAERLQTQEQEYENLKSRVLARLAQSQTSQEIGETFNSRVVADEEVEIELLRRRQTATQGVS